MNDVRVPYKNNVQKHYTMLKSYYVALCSHFHKLAWKLCNIQKTLDMVTK